MMHSRSYIINNKCWLCYNKLDPTSARRMDPGISIHMAGSLIPPIKFRNRPESARYFTLNISTTDRSKKANYLLRKLIISLIYQATKNTWSSENSPHSGGVNLRARQSTPNYPFESTEFRSVCRGRKLDFTGNLFS